MPTDRSEADEEGEEDGVADDDDDGIVCPCTLLALLFAVRIPCPVSASVCEQDIVLSSSHITH